MNRNSRKIICGLLFWRLSLILIAICLNDFFAPLIFSQTAKLPTPPIPTTIPHPPKREQGQKYIDEIWDELEKGTFATPTFDELGTLHEGCTFDELWELAQKHNPTLHKQLYLIKAAKGKKTQVGLYPNPVLSYSGDNLGVHGQTGKHGFSITQEIVTANKIKLDRNVASYDVAAAQKEYSMEYLKLYNDLKIAHNEMLHAILTCNVQQLAKDISQDLLKVALTLQSKGKSRSIDVLQFRTILNAATLNYYQAEKNKLSKWQNITSIIGDPDLPQQPVRGSLIDHSPRRQWQTTWVQFQNTCPQLELAKLKINQSKIQLAREKAEKTSNLYATFSIARDVPAKTNVPFVGVAAPLKFFDKNQGNIAKAGAEVAAANREFERINLKLRKKLTDVFCQYDNSCELINVYEKSIIPDTFEALRQIGEDYLNGKITYLELYTQRKTVVDTLIQYLNALKTKAVTTTQIDGMLLEGNLE
ncbi:MAG: TolC family protein [Planctomycetaceae bacterium]|nr:TolC family protein [Planctomycetaceae bacterium]